MQQLASSPEGVRARESLPGRLLQNRYHIEELLAEGGMGCVYLGYDEIEHRTVAIKVLQAHAATNERMGQRFLHEAQTTMSIVSDHVIRITDLGELDDGSAFFVMDYLDGQTLDSFRVDTLEDVQRITLQVCLGLAAAHEKGVVHRDLKPENIVVTTLDDGSPHCRLIDFGIAKMPFATLLTMPGQVMGTPAYIAPEQAKAGKAIDHRCDIYALGVVLYELVSGTLPFDDEDPIRIALAHLAATPEPIGRRVPGCPPELAALIMRCLEKDPNARPADVIELANELAAMDLHGPLSALDTGPIVEDTPTMSSEVLYDGPDIACGHTVIIDHRRLPISVSDLLGAARTKHITPPEPEPWVAPPTFTIPLPTAHTTPRPSLDWQLWAYVLVACVLALAATAATALH